MLGDEEENGQRYAFPIPREHFNHMENWVEQVIRVAILSIRMMTILALNITILLVENTISLETLLIDLTKERNANTFNTVCI